VRYERGVVKRKAGMAKESYGSKIDEIDDKTDA
jgi:hypothetical protein